MGKLSGQDKQIIQAALCELPQLTTVRGRQAMVRHALSGYPDTDKVLRWLGWEGSVMIFADELVNLLDGHEPVPGVASLGLLTQGIEMHLEASRQQQLQNLRHRMNWSSDPVPVDSTQWQDKRSADDVNRERIIGENTLRPIHYLHLAVRAAEAVVRIEIPGRGYGTGFMISPDLMMTNNHVIDCEANARKAEASFFYEMGAADKPREHHTVGVAETALLFTDSSLDISVVRLREAPRLDHYLTLKPSRLEQDQRVAIVQHPGGYMKKISIQNNLVANADDRVVQYYTSTQPGSSGSPVFDDDFNVVAVHHGWVQSDEVSAPLVKHEDSKMVERTQYRNQGTSCIAVTHALKEQAPELFNEIQTPITRAG